MLIREQRTTPSVHDGPTLCEIIIEGTPSEFQRIQDIIHGLPKETGRGVPDFDHLVAAIYRASE